MTPTEPKWLTELSGEPIDRFDEDVLRRTAALYSTLDPVTDGLIQRVQFGITLDALEAEVAELQRSGELAGARSEEVSTAQTVTFTSSVLTTMITITPVSDELVRLDGWIAPGGGVEVELRTVDTTLRTTADADGRFVFENVRRGLAKFVLRAPTSAGQSVVVTPSIEL